MPPAEKQPPRGTGASALAQLRAFVADGGYQPGMKLPSETQLCQELGLRRLELRRALDVLEKEGVLWRHVGKGTFLSEQPGDSAPGGLDALARTLSPADIMRARAAIEPAIVREAVLCASAAAIAGMEQTANSSRRATTWREYEALDKEFHRKIAQAAGSLTLLALFDQLMTFRAMVPWGSVRTGDTPPPPDHRSFAEHDRIVEALKARDQAAAITAMRRHLQSVAQVPLGL